ncbi:MAG: hypothetical protein E7773_10165 [Sphingomonas sp.]|uniref:hypothetical protein n=1 Tax=Sphingomonas sp. TaxID=28214 RepID=UPI001206C5A3|nr:hypothetical protein [Sphingomonas sp.]THD35702.1 MAG: hypothetical protein E7773_10165 [Sphingomonas sp.]
MKTVDLPALDNSGNLTPLVVEALSKGATSRHHPTDADRIQLCFDKVADAAAFAKLVGAQPDEEPAPAADHSDAE